MAAGMKHKLVAESDEESCEPLSIAPFTKPVDLTDWGTSRRYRNDKAISQAQII